MANIFFFLLIPFVLGLALHWLLVLFYKVGLGFITRFFYRGVFISDDTLFRQDILWNKPQIRFLLALLPCQVLGIIFATMLTDTVTDSSFLKLTLQGTAGIFVAFTSYINFRRKRGKSLLRRQHARQVTALWGYIKRWNKKYRGFDQALPSEICDHANLGALFEYCQCLGWK